MSAQIGYYDTLKSVAGKVFTYLASITLTGTDGKTITCTQDTSLDEAVAMSSKAPKVSPALTTPSLGVATATSINGVNLYGALLAAVPFGTTKTVTVDISGLDVPRSFDIIFAMEDGATGHASMLKLAVAGNDGDASFYLVTELIKVQGTNTVISAVSEGATSFTFTVQNGAASGTTKIRYWYIGDFAPTVTGAA